MFFYDFGEQEVLQELGRLRTGSMVSCCAAEAYVKSSVHLESSYGISNVWYRYVGLNTAKFGGQDSQAAQFPSSTSTHPRPNEKQMEVVGGLFDWKKLHSRPLPIKIRGVLGMSGAETKTYVKKEKAPGGGVLRFYSDLATQKQRWQG